MPIYMKYEGIDGDVTESGHEKWIELNSFQWGVGRGISSPTGASADRESSAPSISEIVVTKTSDKSTPKLMSEAVQGEGKTVEIHFVKTEKGKLTTYQTYKLTNTMISSYSQSSGGDHPSESLSLNFTKVEWSQTGLKADGSPGTPERGSYDLATAKAS